MALYSEKDRRYVLLGFQGVAEVAGRSTGHAFRTMKGNQLQGMAVSNLHVQQNAQPMIKFPQVSASSTAT